LNLKKFILHLAKVKTEDLINASKVFYSKDLIEKFAKQFARDYEIANLMDRRKMNTLD
jgi:hypothetical protein